MKKFIYLFIFFLISQLSLKAKNNEVWNEGYLVLENNTIIKGNIFYNAEKDLVEIKTEQRIKTFSPYCVQYFKFFDPQLQMNRVFATFENNDLRRRENARSFFEVMINGELAVLRKEETSFTPVHEYSYSSIEFIPDKDFSYFISHPEGVRKMKNFNKDVIPLMADKNEEILEYMDKYELDSNNFMHQILIIDFYNYIKDPTYTVLKDQFLVKN